MASLFKPTITRHVLDGKVVSANTPGARKIRTKAEKWYGRFRDASGKIHRVPLATNKEAATAMLAEAIKKAERSTAGLTDPFEEARKLPVSQHVADFRRSLESKGSTAEYVTVAVRRLIALVDGIKAKRLDQLSASRVADWLAEQRRGEMGTQTSNYYSGVAKQFGAWLVRERRLPENPFVSLQRLNARADVRRERRAFSEDELARLVTAANNGPEFRGLTGADRALLYLLAANTGLRAGELASLTVGSFDLTAKVPNVTIEAAYSKHRRRDVLPLRGDIVDMLRPVLSRLHDENRHILRLASSGTRRGDERGSEATQAGAHLWPGTWVERSAKMLRGDLAAARQQWIDEAANDSDLAERKRSSFLAYADESGRVIDFHALRHTFITNLARGGVHPKTAQSLARHSTITLTMDRYTHSVVSDLATALDSLPPVASPEPRVEKLRATGTEGGRSRCAVSPVLSTADDATGAKFVAPPVALELGISCPGLSQIDPVTIAAAEPGNERIPGKNSVFTEDSASEDDGARTRNLWIDSPVL